jgi:hypothetical protein
MNRTFKLDPGAYYALFLGTPFLTALMWLTAFVVPHVGSDALLYVTCAIAVGWIWYLAFQFVRQCPRQIAIIDARVTVWWFGGREETWDIHDLCVPDRERLFRNDADHSGIDVRDADGEKVFKISPHIQKWRELVTLIPAALLEANNLEPSSRSLR